MTQLKITRRRFIIYSCGAIAAASLAYPRLVHTENQPENLFPTTTFGEIKEMNKRILVTYASQAGSTAEVANAIGKKIASHGFLTDVKPMPDVSQLSGYDAVIAGSAIHGGKWLSEGIKFLKSNCNELRKVPFAAFMVCITLGMKNADQYQEGVRAWMEPVRAIVRPNREGYFAGSLDFKEIPFSINALALRAAVKMGALPEGDHRDWSKIDSWADSLVNLF